MFAQNQGLRERGDLTNSSNLGPSPVRMRREIVSGTYGKVKVEVGWTNDVIIRCENIYTAEELREAAHLFSQLAEVLEESNANPR